MRENMRNKSDPLHWASISEDPPKFHDDTRDVAIIPREKWQADHPRTDKLVPNTLPVTCVYTSWLTKLIPFLWEDEKYCKKAIKRLQEFYMREGLPDIPYSFIITSDGLIYEGRGWEYKPDVKVKKQSAIDIAFAPKDDINKNNALLSRLRETEMKLTQFGIKKGYVDKGYLSLRRDVNEELPFIV